MARSSAYIEISRHHIYYFRIRVPTALSHHFPRTFIRRSLQTRCRREAVIRCSVLLEQVGELFRVAASGQVVRLHELSWKRSQERVAVPVLHHAVPLAAQKAGPKFSVVVGDYLQEQRRQGVGEKTLGDKRSVTELMKRIVGNKPIDQISRADARRFKETSLKLPPRMGQSSPRPIKELIREATTTISPTTFNNYIKNLTTVFTYAIQEGYCDRNPLAGLKVQQKVKASDQRCRYTDDDLGRLFAVLKMEKQLDIKPHRQWLPLLGLYTGARLNELCQLYVDDVVQVDGVDCIHIRASRPDQKLKSLTSERVVPLHSQLKSQGFLEYVEHQRALGVQRLFPELTLNKNHGYSHSPSRWFAGVRDRIGLKGGEQKKDFHSFRHTVADHLKQLGVAESLIGGVLGHQTGGITFGRYGKDYVPGKLAVVIELLDFEFTDSER